MTDCKQVQHFIITISIPLRYNLEVILSLDAETDGLISIPLRYNLETENFFMDSREDVISIPLRYNLEWGAENTICGEDADFNSTKVQFGVY